MPTATTVFYTSHEAVMSIMLQFQYSLFVNVLKSIARSAKHLKAHSVLSQNLNLVHQQEGDTSSTGDQDLGATPMAISNPSIGSYHRKGGRGKRA